MKHDLYMRFKMNIGLKNKKVPLYGTEKGTFYGKYKDSLKVPLYGLI